MLVPTPVFRGCLTSWFRRLALLAMGLACLAVLNIAGCPKPTFDEMIPDVTLEQIAAIRNDTTLDTDQKKLDALKALGITDPQLLQILLRAPLPVAATAGETG